MKAPLRAGARLGRFRLLERVALGGMAEVWSALDATRADSAPLALKVMRPGWSDDAEFIGMFRDEVALSLQLRHENIVEVFGGEQIDGHLIQIMELLDGLDLRRVLSLLFKKEARFPIPIAAYIGRALARALAFAHTKRGPKGRILDVVHRDISPHNVLLVRDGRVKLLDFGIAKAAARNITTRAGVIKGKTAYMAPEQVVAAALDHRTDIFAAGIVLWETVAQRRLFKGPSEPVTMELVLRCEVPRLDELREDVPAELASLIHAMLARKPRNRPASMVDIERSFSRLLARTFEPHEYGPRPLAAWLRTLEDGAAKKGTAPIAALPISVSTRGVEDRTRRDDPIPFGPPDPEDP